MIQDLENQYLFNIFSAFYSNFLLVYINIHLIFLVRPKKIMQKHYLYFYFVKNEVLIENN